MIKAGCCGFPTSKEKYYEFFNLVELNVTFYKYPRLETIKKWRREAPKKFEFTIKAHQDITHKAKMKTCEASLQAFKRMKQFCKTLNSRIMLFQTPASFKPDTLKDAEDFFSRVSCEDLILLWETRGEEWKKDNVSSKLANVLEKVNVTHVVDPFTAAPVYFDEIAYFRLHGLGKQMYYYQYSNLELRKLKKLVTSYEEKTKEVYVLFNNLSMFEDAKRFLEFLSKGTFPKITRACGLDSVKEVLEKTHFPISKGILTKKVGWRLIELEDGKQVRLSSLLASLPSKKYESIEDLLKEIKMIKEILMNDASSC